MVTGCGDLGKRLVCHKASASVSRQHLPGDLVSCTVGKRPHIMVVSDRKTPGGLPLVIHNIGRGTREEDRLFAFPLTGHYRVKE